MQGFKTFNKYVCIFQNIQKQDDNFGRANYKPNLNYVSFHNLTM